MEFTVEAFGDVVVVTIPGETLEASISHDFKRDMSPILATHHQVVLDMSRLRFVDSSGCGALLHCLRKTHEHGGDLRLCCVSEQITSLFKIIRLNRKLNLYDTPQAAVSSFKA